MESQPDHEANRIREEFNGKLEEVVGLLGVAILTVAVGTEAAAVGEAWRRLGRSFAELLDLGPPR